MENIQSSFLKCFPIHPPPCLPLSPHCSYFSFVHYVRLEMEIWSQWPPHIPCSLQFARYCTWTCVMLQKSPIPQALASYCKTSIHIPSGLPCCYTSKFSLPYNSISNTITAAAVISRFLFFSNFQNLESIQTHNSKK